jgi:hypothetical protein
MTVDVDPRHDVEAPVHRALEFLIVRGAASFAIAIVAVLITVMAVDGPPATIGHLALPAVLGIVIVARIVHVLVRGAGPVTDGAWQRASAIQGGESRLAAAVAIAVPLAWAAGGAAILVRHAELRGIEDALGVWLPIGGALWVGASIAWAHDCRERLALALDESDRRFRAYWAGLRRSA